MSVRAITRKRNARECRNFKKFFDKPKGITRVVKQSASTYDTMQFISQVTASDVKQVKRYTDHLKSLQLSIRDVCKVIWNDLFGCVAYELDHPGKEQVRTPERLIYDSIGDCDCYTRYLVAVFTSLNIPVLHRKTDYGMGWQHVYVIVPLKDKYFFDPKKPTKDLLRREEYIVIDPVAEKFDYEKPYVKKFDAMSVLQSLEGFTSPTVVTRRVPYSIQFEAFSKFVPEPRLVDTLSGDLYGDLGILKKLRKKIGDGIGKGIRAVKKVGGAVVNTVNRFVNPVTILLRNGLLLGMKLNIFKVAEKLRWAYLPEEKLQQLIRDGRIKFDQSDLDKIRTAQRKLHNTFKAAGGKTENLVKAILNGKGNQDKKVTLNGLGNLNTSSYSDVNEQLITETPWQELETLQLLPIEYETTDGRIITMDGEGRIAAEGLGTDPGSGAAIAAATAALKVLAELLKSARQPEVQEEIFYDDQVISEMDNLPFDAGLLSQEDAFDLIQTEVPMNQEPNQENDPKSKGGKTGLIIGTMAIAGLVGYAIWSNNKTNATLSGIDQEDEEEKKVVKRKRKKRKQVAVINLK